MLELARGIGSGGAGSTDGSEYVLHFHSFTIILHIFVGRLLLDIGN